MNYSEARKFGSTILQKTRLYARCVHTESVWQVEIRFLAKNHAETAKHKKAVSNNAKRQFFIDNQKKEGTSAENGSFRDMARGFVKANIPLNKIEQPDFRASLEKHTGKSCPHKSTLRRDYLFKEYTEKLDEIRKDLANSGIFIIVDESQDVQGRSIAAVLIGKSNAELSKPPLVDLQELEKTDNVFVTRLINTKLSKIYGAEIPYERVRILMSVAAAYLRRVGNNMKSSFYPNLLHITCMAHGLHRVAEFVRDKHKVAEKFIAATKLLLHEVIAALRHTKEELPDYQGTTLAALNMFWLTSVHSSKRHFIIVKVSLKFLTISNLWKRNEVKLQLPWGSLFLKTRRN